MKACRECGSWVASTRSVCAPCIEKRFQNRATQPKKGRTQVTPSDANFTEDAPRFEREYECDWLGPRDPKTDTGRTTAIALGALSSAIQVKRMVKVHDHATGRPGQVALIRRLESIAAALNWPVEVVPETGLEFGVQVTAKRIPSKCGDK